MEDKLVLQVSSLCNSSESVIAKETTKLKNEDTNNSDEVIEEKILVNGEVSSSTVEEPKLAKSFPWLIEFVKKCRAEIGATNITTLENLMTVFLERVGSSVIECYVKPNRAAKLKRCMSDTLGLFYMLYCDIKKPLEHSSYLDKMSDLMGYYIDMEIKASRRGKESLPKIASKLTSSLYLFLDHSIDHILDSILKTRNMTKNYCELCTYIFKRVLKDVPVSAVYEMTYVRYILVFKMWKRVVKGCDERKKVMKIAATRLVPPAQFREKLKSGLLCGVLPKIPKSRNDITMFLMQAKFCVKDKSKVFLKVVSDPKQQCALGQSLSADLDRPLFFGDGGDSPHNSNSDDQEDTSGSSMLMNDIWSSMSLESGLRDHFRLSSVTAKKSKNSKSKLKKKSKSSNSKGEGNVGKVGDKNKKKTKKKLKKVDGKNEKENRCSDESHERPSAQEVKAPVVVHSSSEVSESCTQTVAETSTKECYESTPMIPIENIKVEADSSDDVCFVGIIRKGDNDLDTSDINNEIRRDSDIEALDVAREVEIRSDSQSSVKLERPGTAVVIQPSVPSHPHDIFLYDQQPPTEWSPAAPTQNYFNNAVCDFINGYLPDFDLDTANTDLDHRDIYDMLDMGKSLQTKHKEMFPTSNENVLGQLPLEDDSRNNVDVSSSPVSESCPGAAGGKVTLASRTDHEQHITPVHQTENQEKIDELIESFKEQGRYPEKTPETNISDNTSSVTSEVETKSKEKGPLHYRTLTSDHSIFISQQQLRSLYVTEVVPPSIPVPSPPKMDSSSRCDCDQCTSNYEVLLTNYKKLTAYKNSKVNSANAYKKTQEDDIGKESEDSEPGKYPRSENHSSLPLKKRKAIQPSSQLKKEAKEISYPCTPMMSIAELALGKSRVEMQPSTILASKPTTVTAVVDYNTSSNVQPYSYSSGAPATTTAQPSCNVATASTGSNNSAIAQGQNQHKKYVVDSSATSTYPNTVSITNLTNTVQSSSFQRSFKTPAQLKEGISVPSVDLNAAQDLINFARNSHSYYNQTQNSDGKANKRSRTKARTDRNHSKKRRM